MITAPFLLPLAYRAMERSLAVHGTRTLISSYTLGVKWETQNCYMTGLCAFHLLLLLLLLLLLPTLITRGNQNCCMTELCALMGDCSFRSVNIKRPKGYDKKMDKYMTATTYMGIDISKKKCDYYVLGHNGNILKKGQYTNTIHDAKQIAEGMIRKYGTKNVNCCSSSLRINC